MSSTAFRKKVLMVVCGKGRAHNFRLFKQCRLTIHQALKKYADASYQGLAKLYANSFTLRKDTKTRPLAEEDKAYNREFAQQRIPIEHVNRRCKIFRSVKETYHGTRTHYHKTWTLHLQPGECAICGFPLPVSTI